MSEEPIINIRKSNIYQHKNLVLSDVELKIHPGELVYIIGKTGSGKSSLLRALYADLDFTKMDADIAGFDLSSIKRKQIPFLRRKLGIIFQDFQLLPDRNVQDNLLFVLRATGWRDKKEMKKRVEEVLIQVSLSTKGYKLPHQLSGGEQQRVAVARALLNDPEIILADEPTGNLDPETSLGILKLLYEITKSGTAVILATHDYSLLHRYPSRVIRCKDGKLFEEIEEGV